MTYTLTDADTRHESTQMTLALRRLQARLAPTANAQTMVLCDRPRHNGNKSRLRDWWQDSTTAPEATSKRPNETS